MRQLRTCGAAVCGVVGLGVVAMGGAASGPAADVARSAWVHPGPDGRLVYQTTTAGDRIMDFSSAGYHGGGVALPSIAVKRTVQPSGTADDTAAIQAAIDAVAALPLEGGFRGAVLLGPGTFTCGKTIMIRASGIVLRGSGSGPDGTTIRMVGPHHAAIVIGSERGQAPGGDSDDPGSEPPQTGGLETRIADRYLPSGATTLMVADAKGFRVGDRIAVHRPTTAAWVRFMQMDAMKRNGRPQTWLDLTRVATSERRIKALSGNRLTLDIPLADSYDAKLLDPPGTTVVKLGPSSRVAEVGVEQLHIQCPPLEIAYGQAPYSAIRVGGDDCWVRDVFCEETMNSTTLAGRRITVQQVVVTHTFPNLGASKPTDFSIEGSQVLLDRCRITGDNEYFVWTGSMQPGPNVLLNCVFRGRGSRIQPHQRWATGMLVDNCRVPGGGIDYMNRGAMGSGHGWTMGWGVVWNSVADSYVVQNPPGVLNWVIGSIGRRVPQARPFDAAPNLPEGIFDSHGVPVAPRSLYLAQLAERLGPQSLRRIGYADPEGMLAAEPVAGLAPLPSWIDPVLGTDLALYRPVDTRDLRGRTRDVRRGAREFGGEKALDGDPETYWAVDDGVSGAMLEVDTEGPLEIDAVSIEEALGARVQEYKVEGQVDSDWKLLARGTTIGERKVDRFPKVTVWKVRLTVLKTQGYPAIREFGFYLTPAAAS